MLGFQNPFLNLGKYIDLKILRGHVSAFIFQKRILRLRDRKLLCVHIHILNLSPFYYFKVLVEQAANPSSRGTCILVEKTESKQT